MFLVSSVRLPPSVNATSTTPGAWTPPQPRTYSTLFFLNKNSMPWVLLSITDCL